MMRQRSGSVINMTSIVGISGNAGQANYAASKAGMIGLTKSVAKELGGRNIRVNAIAPGFIATEMTGVLNEDMKKQWILNIPLHREGKVPLLFSWHHARQVHRLMHKVRLRQSFRYPPHAL